MASHQNSKEITDLIKLIDEIRKKHPENQTKRCSSKKKVLNNNEGTCKDSNEEDIDDEDMLNCFRDVDIDALCPEYTRFLGGMGIDIDAIEEV